MEIKNICVYCSSSDSLDEIFYDEAETLGYLLAKNGYNVVYGGSKLGLMYKVSKTAKDNGSKVIGVMPEKLYDLGVSEQFCDEFYLTEGMRERKAKLDEKSDGIIALAGGFGTLEELAEMIVQKQLCYNKKPIVILNTAGFYDDLLRFFEKIIYKKFANQNAKKLYFIANSPVEAVEYLKNYKEEEIGFGKEGLLQDVIRK
ncbi:MAG: TIGR00730 family Rossman fold protein [bacterium]|nr:TIGR00730 family Rossman fold protein [bacterium]